MHANTKWLMAGLFTPLSIAAVDSAVQAASPKEPTKFCIDDVCPRDNDYHLAGYSLAFSDEFDGTSLDRQKWCTRLIWGGGATPQFTDATCQQFGQGTLDFLNDEQQRYVDVNTSGTSLHVVSAGVLTLTATKTRSGAYDAYESGMVRSKATFRPTPSKSYYITARVNLPDVRGSWPAFWLNSDWDAAGKTSWPPEIDIFEAALNEKEDKASMLHQAAVANGGKQTLSGKAETIFKEPRFEGTWNNFMAEESLRSRWIQVGVEWTHEQVCYFIDGTKTKCERYKWVYNDGTSAAAAHVIMNLAIGGGWAGRYGIANEKFPVRMLVDYIRVYEK